MVYKGKVKNGVVVLEGDARPPEGAEVRVEAVGQPGGATLAERFSNVIGIVDDLPPDMARNHDHYLHGAPMQ